MLWSVEALQRMACLKVMLIHPCVVCGLSEKANSALCVQCGKRTHSKCAGARRVTPKFSRHLVRRKCEGNIGKAMEQEKTSRNKVETARHFAFHVSR